MTCPPSEEIIRQVRERCGPRTILSFSRGKDAIASYIAIRDHFEEIVGYHLFLAPGLEFVEESLDYYRRKLGIRILNLPHPSLYRWINAGLYQPPERAPVIVAADLPSFDYLDIHRIVCEETGLDVAHALIASGVRAADSPIRRVAFQTHGAISERQRQYYPVYDWNKARLIEAIDRSGIKLPVDYEWFGRSFDGINFRFLYPLKQHAPRDYAKVLEWFPLAELEIWEYERSLAA